MSNPEQLFPVESIHGLAHTLILGGKEYDIYKLIHQAKGIESTDMDLIGLRSQVLKEKCWKDENGNMFSPEETLHAFERDGSWEKVIKNNPGWKDHIEKILNANFSYPILMYRNEVIDGMHRLIKALSEHVPSIPVKILSVLPEEALYVEKSAQ